MTLGWAQKGGEAIRELMKRYLWIESQIVWIGSDFRVGPNNFVSIDFRILRRLSSQIPQSLWVCFKYTWIHKYLLIKLGTIHESISKFWQWISDFEMTPVLLLNHESTPDFSGSCETGQKKIRFPKDSQINSEMSQESPTKGIETKSRIFEIRPSVLFKHESIRNLIIFHDQVHSKVSGYRFLNNFWIELR